MATNPIIDSPPPFPTCTEPSGQVVNRRLVICIDGTSNQFGLENTNVVELYRRLPKSDRQLTYYNSGIGTFANPSRNILAYWFETIASVINMAFALDVDRTIMNAYEWLSEVYQPGDAIYLIGYSRGAYQVRAIAGMLKLVGLIKSGNKAQIGFAYELYSNAQDGTEPKWSWWQKLLGGVFFLVILCLGILMPLSILSVFADDIHRYFDSQVSIVFWVEVVATVVGGFILMLDQAKPSAHSPEEVQRLAAAFKRTFSYPSVHIHFVGVWDTVSAIGAVGGKTLPFTHNGDHICFFRHALALDEARGRFFPEFAESTSILNNASTANAPYPQLKEVWFPGQHSDVGGLTGIDALLTPQSNGNPSLRWMAYEVQTFGLAIKDLKSLAWAGKPLYINPFMGQFWRNMENVPIRRFTLDEKGNRVCTYSPNSFKGRKIRTGQKLHFSVALCEAPYHPKARMIGSRSKARCRDLSCRVRTKIDGMRVSLSAPAGSGLSEVYTTEAYDQGCTNCDLSLLDIEYDTDLFRF